MAANTLPAPPRAVAVTRSLSADRYVPDLKGLLNDCEANYLRFLRLLPSLDETSEWSFAMEMPTAELSKVVISVVERSRYTTTVALCQASHMGEWVPEPSITVRLYHDVRVAEVLSYQKNHRIKPSYEYPNKKMYHRNEKAELNRFLGEWLDSCLKSGCAIHVPVMR
ncbi:MAG: hypothetical protein CSA49_01955 [Gammaproteobacteria bacterium]|nr:MAG: hypothetical protein CSA49_01955 [Gammaproteobacteria bacterium]